MLIGAPSNRPSLQAVRRIKRSLHEALGLSDDDLITVTQLACLEEDCAPLETVIGLLRPSRPQLQHKVHKDRRIYGRRLLSSGKRRLDWAGLPYVREKGLSLIHI